MFVLPLIEPLDLPQVTAEYDPLYLVPFAINWLDFLPEYRARQ